MAQGTVLAEIVLDGEKSFKRGISSAGDKLEDTSDDATTLSASLGRAGEALDETASDATGLLAAASVAGEALDELRDDALGTSAGMFALRSTTDEAGDEMFELVPKATSAAASTSVLGAAAGGTAATMVPLTATTQGASTAMTSFGISAEGASIGVSTLSTTVSAAAVPALAALSTTLLPIAAVAGTAATALGSLAGAFGLVIGSGAIAGFEQLKSTFKESLGLIKAQLTGFGQSAIPVLDNILGQLPALVSDILGAFGGTGTFLDALSAGFQTLRDVAPAVVRTMRELAVDALPVLKDVISFLIQNGPSIFREMVSTTKELAPQIMEFVDAVIGATPALLEFGTFVFSTVVPGLTEIARKATPVVNAFASFSDEAQAVQGVFNKLPAGIQAIAMPLKFGLVPALAAAKAAVNALGLDWEKTITRLEWLTQSVFSSVVSIIDAGMQAAGDLIDESWKGIVRSSIGFLNTLLSKATMGIEGLTNLFIDGANTLIGSMNNLITEFNSNVPGADFEMFSKLDTAEFSAPQLDVPKSVRKSQNTKQQIEVEVSGRLREEDGEIIAVIDDRAETKIEQNDRKKAGRGRRSRPI